MIKDILESYRNEEISDEEAEEEILNLFYEEGENFLLDLHREKRVGFPEIIYGEPKETEDLLDIVKETLKQKNKAFISSVDKNQEKNLKEKFNKYLIRKKGDLLVIKKKDTEIETIGKVGVITGGTSDVPFAEECSLLLEELGVEVIKSHDSGVSGIHRAFISLKKMEQADVIIVFAGMEGVLPPIIGSMTEKPVIAVPTPVGYGHGGEGEGALTTMLQSCVPGILVVNIGNTIGAAAGAIRILNSIKGESSE